MPDAHHLLTAALASLQGYRREMGDTQPCDAEKAIAARLATPSPAGEPEMPDVDLNMRIPYEAIRYVPGFTVEFVRQYARTYGRAMAEHARRVALEDAAKAIEAFRDQHCRDTEIGRDEDTTACTPDCNDCDFVVAWNDSIHLVRALAGKEGQG